MGSGGRIINPEYGSSIAKRRFGDRCAPIREIREPDRVIRVDLGIQIKQLSSLESGSRSR